MAFELLQPKSSKFRTLQKRLTVSSSHGIYFNKPLLKEMKTLLNVKEEQALDVMIFIDKEDQKMLLNVQKFDKNRSSGYKLSLHRQNSTACLNCGAIKDVFTEKIKKTFINPQIEFKDGGVWILLEFNKEL